jgi:LysM repeat protein
MDESIEARNEYIKFLVLLLFFGALMVGAAMLRPLILDGLPAPQPTQTPVEFTLSSHPTPTVAPVPTATPTALPTPTLTPVITPAVAPTPTPEPRVYIVRPGDNLYRIGQEHGVTVDRLVAINRIANRHVIQAGQSLTIPNQEVTVPADDTYVIQWGDTLWGISRKFGLELEELVAANEIRDPSRIIAGQVLIIPR